MKPPVETVRVSQRSREILIALKRKTGIANWNVLCRWAFCDSLANPNRPVATTAAADSNIEMSWETFAGSLSDPLLAAFYRRADKDGVSGNRPERTAYFRGHLERGIRQLGRKPRRLLEGMVVQRGLEGHPPAEQHTTGGLIGDHEQHI